MAGARFIISILFLALLGCETYVTYDEEKKDFVVKKGMPEEGSITIDPGEDCKIVEDIFIVCGK
tara:strand:- start:753 stop:944 length:192 start_codon:yes stop_codon:yes gene_type:complete